MVRGVRARRARLCQRLLLPVAFSLAAGCGRDGGKSRSQVEASDGGRDTGGDDDGGTDPTPSGKRPALERPGQVVPLLYGRTVNADQIVEDQVRAQRIPLDDPSHPAAQALLAALDSACSAELADLVAAPSASGSSSGCGAAAVYQMHEALCRSRMASTFADADARAGLVETEDGYHFDASGSMQRDQRWRVRADSSHARASWALLAVHELRSAVATAASAFDTRTCSGSLARKARSGVSLAQLAADALTEAYERLPDATAKADALLRERLVERARELEPLNQEARALLTRDITDSVLERMKLHAAIPYAAFIPADGEREGVPVPYDRYPAVPGAPAERTGAAAVMLAALGTEVLNAEGFELTGATLLEAWFASLRDAQPNPFGGLPEASAERALGHFGLAAEELEGGARWLVQAVRASGTPRARSALARGPWHTLRGLRYLDAPGPSAYPYLLTEARATLELDPCEYALRGSEHALELAARSARMAAEREDAAEARVTLQRIGAGVQPPPVRVCLTNGDAGIGAELEIAPAEGERLQSSSYAVYRGEDDAVCATRGEAAGRVCAPRAVGAPATRDDATGSLHIRIDRAEPGEDRFYLVEASGEPVVVAGVSLSPLDAVDERRCYETPRSARLHHALHAVHREDLAPLTRVPALPEAQATFTPGPGLTLPTLWGQQVSVQLGGETRSLDLAQPFDAGHLRTERALLADCAAQRQARGASAEAACELGSLASLDSASCMAQKLAEAADTGLTTDDLSLRARDADEALALALWAFEARKRELVLAAHALEALDCAPPDEHRDAARELEQTLWSRAEAAFADLEGRYRGLRETIPAAWRDRFAEREPAERAVLEARAPQASRLAAARLLMAIPSELYEAVDDAQETDPLEHALDRFPVVARPARYAEDTRAEQLLRRAELHPLLPGRTVSSHGLDATELTRAYAGDALALALRARLLAEEPGTYQTAPADAAGFLAFLGITRGELAAAAARIVQLGEARGSGVLIARGAEEPVRALALRATSPAPSPAHLYALSEGRAAFSHEAWPTSFGMRGFFHAVADAARALARRAARATAWTQQLREQRLASIARFEHVASPVSVDFSLSQPAAEPLELAVALTLPAAIAERDALHRFELWWTDAGLACALSGDVAGSACSEQDFRFATRDATAEVTGPLDSPRLQLRGLRLPTPSSWSPALSLAHDRARIYLTERVGATRRVVAGLALSPALSGERSVQVPVSDGFARALVELLAYRPPGEGCRDCAPASICETTRCELGVCLRAPAPEPLACGRAGTCTQGTCSAPGCGDGARSDGSAGVPYEPCDDGNLQNGDGCSASCTLEQRALEPLIEEAYPAGPAPAVGVDGLGRALIVYTADALDGESVSIRSALFDAFGVKRGSTATLVEDVARGYRSEPSVTGLRDGGFVVVSADARAAQAGITLRIIDGEGTPGAPRAVDASGAIQSEPRVAAQDDGFLVAWSERDARNPVARLRVRRFDAQGEPFGPSSAVAAPKAGGEQHQPALVSSLDQALVVWAERSIADGASLGIRAQRFSPLGYPVEDAALMVAELGEQPSAAAMQTDDYLVAWTARGGAGGADVNARVLRRFGPALQESVAQPLAATELAEDRPLVLAAAGAHALVIYQRGAPRSSPVLHGPSIDPGSLRDAQTALARSAEADVSGARGPHGIWLVWSERADQRRSLHTLLVPFDAAPGARD